MNRANLMEHVGNELVRVGQAMHEFGPNWFEHLDPPISTYTIEAITAVSDLWLNDQQTSPVITRYIKVVK